MPLFAEGDFWTWMMKLTDKVFDPTFWASFVAAVGVLVKLYRDWNVPGDLKKNTDATEAVMPKVAEKIDSGTKSIEMAQQKAEKAADGAALNAVIIIGDKLEKKAEVAATKVAEVAMVANDKLADKMDKVATALKGEDGTCLTSKVNEHNEMLVDHGKVLNSLEDRISSLERKVTDGFDKIMDKLQ